MESQKSKVKNQNYKTLIKFILFFLTLNFTLLTFNLSVVKAQTIDPSVWQTQATGLRTSTNDDKKTAGLSLIIKATGIPFLSLQGGVANAGWGKLSGPPKGIELGEVKIPGTTPTLTAESADWAHNEMTFSNNLKIRVSRLSSAILIQNQNNYLRLFSGNLGNGATIQSSNAEVVNRAAAPAYPKYVAYQSGGSIRVQAIPASGAAALNLPALDNNWILVWYGNNSYFLETNRPFSYYSYLDSTDVGILPHSEAYTADAPLLLKFENNPSSIRQSSEGGIDINFSGNSGNSLLIPLLGREHPKASDTENWRTSGTLPADIQTRINFWTSGNRLCSYPTTVTETYAYDTNSDTSSITENITYLPVCNGGSATSGFAILPPTVALAKDALGVTVYGGTLTDTGYPTEFGPIIGIDNTNNYSWSVRGLKKYTDNKRVLTNPGNIPADLLQKLNNEINKTVQDGHYLPWIYPQHLPEVDYTMAHIYYLNPADVIYQLTEVAQALPDSADAQSPKNRLIDYIKSERNTYQPETVYNLPNTGTQRIPHAIRNLESSTLDGGLNNFQTWQNRNPHLFLKRVPLYNFYALAKYYELPTTGNIPTSVLTAAKTALNNDLTEQDWASFTWFRGFNKGIWTGHSTLINVNRLFDGLIGFVKLSKAVSDPDESLGRALLTKVAVQRVAMAKYPRYLYAANLQTLPSDPDWMPKYAAGNWQGFVWNYNWRVPFDDPRVIATQDQFGTFLSDSTSFYPPSPLKEIRDYEYLANAQLSAYNNMTPETLRLVTDFAKQDLEIYLNRVTTLMPHWYMPYIEDFVGIEHGTTLPINSYQLFMAKDFVQKDTPDNLRKYASFSWLDSGDFFYMQKLAEAIKAYQGVAWEDEVNPPSPTPTPVPCTISSATWGSTSVVEGGNIVLNTAASGDCTGKQVNFEVRRNLNLQPDQATTNKPSPNPVSLTVSGNNFTASTSWTSDSWVDNCPLNILTGPCDPEYFFKVNVVGETNTTDSNPRIITVSRSVTGPAASATDWPQVQKDPQHTGYSPETLGTNFQVAWTYPFQPDRVHPQVQAIIYDKKVFVGTEHGNMYAIYSGSGGSAGQKAWSFKADGSIVRSAVADNGKVFFATLSGSIYALNTTNGEQVWKNQLSIDRGFSAAPILADNKILLGGEDGYFYALSPNDGSVLWKYKVGRPILQTAAYDNGRVFFGAMDMHVYALNTSPANPNDSATILAWQSQRIPAAAFKDFWPVIYQNKVFIIPTSKVMDPGITPNWFFANASWLSTWRQTIASGATNSVPELMNAQDTVMTNYQSYPQNFTKNIFVLDENTGQEVIVIPHWSVQTHSGTTPPPCVDREGKLIMPVWFVGSGWGRLDLTLNRYTDILFDGYDTGYDTNGTTVWTGSPGQNLYPAGFGNRDENYAVSCANNTILSRHYNDGGFGGAGYTGYFNLDNRRWTGIPRGYQNGQMNNNVQGGGGTNPMSISNGLVYDVVFHELVARTTQ